MIEAHVKGRRVPRIVGALVLAALCALSGCGVAKVRDPPHPNWTQMEKLLSSPDVRVTTDLFAALSKLPTDQRSKDSYADTRARDADFEPIEQYMAQIEHDGQTAVPKLGKRIAARNPDGLKKILSELVTWKSRGSSWGDIKRVYMLATCYPTEAERMVQWDNTIAYRVFTDGQGRILAWLSTQNNHLYSE